MPEQINTVDIPVIKPKSPVIINQYQPTMQGISTQIANDEFVQSTSMQGNVTTLSDSEVGNRVKNSSEMTQSPYTLPVTLATWFGISQGMDFFGKACNKPNYDDSILGKFSRKFDNFSNAITNNKLANSSVGQFIGNTYNTICNKIKTYADNPKNRIAYALKYHKTRPENKLVIGQAAGVNGFLYMDTKNVFDEFLKPTKNAENLKQYGFDQNYVDNFLNKAKNENWNKERFAKELQLEELKYFGVDVDKLNKKSIKDLAKALEAKRKVYGLSEKETKFFELCKKDKNFLANNAEKIKNELLEETLKEKKITKGFGFKNVKQYLEFTKDEQYALSHIKELKNILAKGDKNIKVMIWKGDGALGKIKGFLFGREIGVSELFNKYNMLTDGSKTKFGKFSNKAFAYLLEGTTNRFAGGKIAVLMQAFIFADMIIHTAKAPEGEKGKTFAERFVNDFSYFLAIPLGISIMHKLGGLKYLGVSKENVEKFRNALKTFNEKAKNKGFSSKADYKAELDKLTSYLKTDIKNPIVKLLKKSANLLTVGLERIRPYKSQKKFFNLNGFRQMGFLGKNVPGYIIRFALPMFVFSPKFAKFTTELTHKIFGRPTNSVLDEEKEDETKEQNELVNNIINQQMMNQNPNNQADTNLIRNKINQINEEKRQAELINAQNPNNQTTPNNEIISNNNTQAQNTTPNNNDEVNNQQDPQRTYVPSPEPVRTYVPSPTPVALNTPDTSAYETALAKADRAEQFGYEVLKSLG